MYYQALATDYDGTLATDGVVWDSTLEALEALRRSGRKLIMVTGRELEDLQSVFPRLDLFDLVVAENGALLYRPKDKKETLLAEPPPVLFRQRLEGLGFKPLSFGRVIIATVEPHETEILAAIRDLGLELQIIFNKGSVMVLPPGVNKASGLQAALKQLGLSPHNVVGVGDAENDFALLELSGCGAAVANALPMLKQAADVTLDGARGDGVAELARHMVKNDLVDWDETLSRRQTAIGHRADDSALLLPPRANLLLTGRSGSGKAALADRIIDQLLTRHFQTVIVDVEGDHAGRKDALVLSIAEMPEGDDLSQRLERSHELVVIDLSSLPIGDRPAAARDMLGRLAAMRARTGRPHFIVIEKAHLVLPAEFAPEGPLAAPTGLFLVTVHPELIAPPLLKQITLALAVGDAPESALKSFADAAGLQAPIGTPAVKLSPKSALVWDSTGKAAAEPFEIAPAKESRRSNAA